MPVLRGDMMKFDELMPFIEWFTKLPVGAVLGIDDEAEGFGDTEFEVDTDATPPVIRCGEGAAFGIRVMGHHAGARPCNPDGSPLAED